MPRHQEAMKEVEDCCKLRGAVNQALIRRFPNGETHYVEDIVSMPEYIGYVKRTATLLFYESISLKK